MQKLFVYGTLEIPQVVKKLLGTVPIAQPAILQDYARFLLINRDYPGIVRQTGQQVEGILYRGVTPKHLRILDRYEDDIYQRCTVKLITEESNTEQAWAYVIPDRYKHLLTQAPWNKNQFVKLHLKRFLHASS